MTHTNHTHAENINSLGLAHEARRLAEYLRRWSAQNTDAVPASIEQAYSLADSLDQWAHDQQQQTESTLPIIHSVTATTRKRPRPAELPSVAALLGQKSSGETPNRRVKHVPKFAQPNGPTKKGRGSELNTESNRTIAPREESVPLFQQAPSARYASANLSPKLASGRATIVNTSQPSADAVIPILTPPTPVEDENKPRWTIETAPLADPTRTSLPVTTSAPKPRSVATGEVRRARDITQRRPVADRSDLSIPARWWNIPIAITLLIGIAVAMGGIGVEGIRVAHSQSLLARVLDDPKATSDQIVAAARGIRSSPLARWDANRELLTARATLLAMERATGLSSDDQSIQRENARVLFRRAADRLPQSPWHRMNVALAAPAAVAADLWENLTPLIAHEPIVAQQSALYQIRAGNRSEGLAVIARQIRSQPTSADRLARSLLNSGGSVNELMTVMPDSPEAVGGLLNILQTDAVIGLRRAIEDRLTQLTVRATNSDELRWKSSDWESWGEIEARMDRWSEAATKFERAIELDPTNVRYKLRLASVRADQQNMDEAKRLLAELPMKLSPDQEALRRNILTKLGPTRPTSPQLTRANAN